MVGPAEAAYPTLADSHDKLPLFFSQFGFHPFGYTLHISVDAGYVDIPSGRQHFGQQLHRQTVGNHGRKFVLQ